MKLIPEIREAWRYSSVRLGGVATLAGLYWVSMSKDEQVELLTSIGLEPAHIPMALGLAFILARITSFRKDGQ